MTSLESLLGSSQSGVDPGEAKFLRNKERTRRTQRMIATCKGSFTNEIKKFISTAEYFMSKEADLSVTHRDCAIRKSDAETPDQFPINAEFFT